MFKIFSCIGVPILLAATAYLPTQAQELCSTQPDLPECAEEQSAPAEPDAPVDSGWQVSQVETAFGSTPALLVSARSDGQVKGMFDSSGPVVISARCQENTTSIFFNFGNNFMSDVGNYGSVIYQIDQSAISNINFRASADNTSLGLFDGASAIPFIKNLLLGSKLLVRVSTFEDETLEAQFNIAGLEAAIAPLRQRCAW